MAIINGTLGADNLIGTSANDTINGLGGADTISAGDGNDQINEAGNLVGSSIDGGSGGWDSLTVQTNGSAVVLGANVKGIENFNIDAQGSANPQNITITNDAFNGIQGTILSLTGYGASQKIDASLVTAGSVYFHGGSESDYFIGGAGNDIVWSFGGNDTIDGGLGNNTVSIQLGQADSTTLNNFILTKGNGQNWFLSSGGVNWFQITQPSTTSNNLSITDLRNSTQLYQDSDKIGSSTLSNIQTINFTFDYVDASLNKN